MKASNLFIWDLVQIPSDKVERTEAAESNNMTRIISIVDIINFPGRRTGN